MTWAKPYSAETGAGAIVDTDLRRRCCRPLRSWLAVSGLATRFVDCALEIPPGGLFSTVEARLLGRPVAARRAAGS